MINWLTVSPLSGTNNYDLTVSSLLNESDKRYAFIKAKNTTHNIETSCLVTQLYYFKINKESIYFDAGFVDSTGYTNTFCIDSTVSWYITSKPSWVNLSQLQGNSGETTISVIVPANLEAEREGTIIITAGNISKSITIKQGEIGYIKYLTASRDVLTPTSGGSIHNVYFSGYGYYYVDNKTIDSYSFRDNTDILAVETHNINYINIYAFYNCSNLTTLSFDNQLLTLGNCAFGNIGNLNVLTLPASLTGTTSGRWFEHITINKLNVACNLSGSTTYTSYDLNGNTTAHTTTVIGVDVTVNTVEMLSGSTASAYSLAFSGLNNIIINDGASYSSERYLYSNKAVITDSGGNQRTVYSVIPDEIGTLTKPSSVDWPKPYDGWTVQDAS